MQHVEAEFEGAAVGPVVDFDGPGVEVDAHGLVLGAHVDAVAVPELLGCAGHELVDGEDVTADEIGDAARRVTGPPALLHHHDLEVGTAASGLGSRTHGSGVTADHDQTLGHLRSLSQPLTAAGPPLDKPSAMMASWPCKSIAVTI